MQEDGHHLDAERAKRDGSRHVVDPEATLPFPQPEDRNTYCNEATNSTCNFIYRRVLDQGGKKRIKNIVTLQLDKTIFEIDLHDIQVVFVLECGPHS
jgi:hypothetical protein